MGLALVVIAALALVTTAHAVDVRVVTMGPVEDMSLPFWCDWGYDWEERCYRDDSDRLGVGGGRRQGVARSFAFLARRATAAGDGRDRRGSLWYDRVCVAPRRRIRACDGAATSSRRIRSIPRAGLHEREVEFGPSVAEAALGPNAASGWLVWDLTDVVADWRSGGLANDRVLLKLADGLEDFDSSGPAFASSSYADPALRPRLTVWYLAG